MIKLYFITTLTEPVVRGILLLRVVDRAYTIEDNGRELALAEARALAVSIGAELEVIEAVPEESKPVRI